MRQNENRVPSVPVIIYTDGACSGNPGPGGWAAVLLYGHHRKEISGGEKQTTNQRMELTAAIKALQALKRPCKVLLHTDSDYLASAFTQGWLEKWERNGWKNARGKPVKNRDLWQQLLDLTSIHQVEWVKVRGHTGNYYNELCDRLARQAIARS